MALIRIVRSAPERENGPVTMDIPEEDFPILNKRGWSKATDKPGDKKENKVPVEPVDKKEDKKAEEPFENKDNAAKETPSKSKLFGFKGDK